MKKLLLFLLLFLFTGNKTHAHILKTEGSIGAVIHIDPEDDPIVGEPSTIYFEFKDKENSFFLTDCDCELTILQNGKAVYTETLTSETVVYTFPEKNIYSLIVKGTPRDNAQFKAFTLSYDLRVSRERSTPTVTTPMLSLPVIIGIGILTIGVLFAIIRQELQRRKK